MRVYRKRVVDTLLQKKLKAKGAANLLRLRNKIDTSRMKEASFLMVLAGVGEYAYKRDYGVLVVPIGSLRN